MVVFVREIDMGFWLLGYVVHMVCPWDSFADGNIPQSIFSVAVPFKYNLLDSWSLFPPITQMQWQGTRTSGCSNIHQQIGRIQSLLCVTS